MEPTVNFINQAYKQALFPSMLAILGGTINILVDGILVGQKLGAEGLAAIHLCLPIYLFLCVIGSFLVSGTATQASRALGKSDVALCARYYRAAVKSTVIAGLIATLMSLWRGPIASFLCSDPSLWRMVADYSGITLLGALPKVLIYVPFWFLRLNGQNKTLTLMMAVMGFGNILLDIVFLFVFDLGVAGAAWASVISTGLACVIGMWCLSKKKGNFSFAIAGDPLDGAAWLKVVKSGAPAALNNLFHAFRTLFVNFLLMKYGGVMMVAVFFALNCVSAFSLCVIDGVPQGASAMLGTYCGEYDHSSIKLLIQRQWKSGLGYVILFSILAVTFAPIIQMAYGLSTAMFFPILALTISFIPALLNGIFISYYNLLEKSLLASSMVFFRVLFFAVGSLWVLLKLSIFPWWFFACGELLTVLFWFVATGFICKRHKNLSRYLLLDDVLEREGKVMNFSVEGTAEAICEASERITEFCENNNMAPKQSMGISLSIEEILTVITKKNPDQLIDFDIKAFSLQGVMGIRIRYGGIAYNPVGVAVSEEDMDFYMGIGIIEKMAEDIVYQSTFGTNSLQIFV